MTNYLSPLKLKDYLTLTGLIIIGFGWLLIDQIILPALYQRFVAFIVLMLILYYLQFAINRPSNVIKYAHAIAAITVLFIVTVSLVLHVIIKNDFSYKSILIWLIAGLLPYAAALLYLKTSKRS